MVDEKTRINSSPKLVTNIANGKQELKTSNQQIFTQVGTLLPYKESRSPRPVAWP